MCSQRALEDPPALGRGLGLLILAAKIGARALGLEQLRELLERQAEQVTEADDLPDPLDVGLGVAAVLALACARAAPPSRPISS